MLPASKTWASREQATAAKLNEQVRDVHKWMENPPLFTCQRTTALTVTGGSTLTNTWDSYSGNGFTTVTDVNGKITGLKPKFAGKYLLHVQMCGKVSAFPSHFYLALAINGNGQQVGVIQQESTAYMDSARVTGVFDLTTADTISTQVYISSARTAYLTDTAEQQLATVFLGYWIGV